MLSDPEIVMSAVLKPKVSLQEYLDWENDQPERHELVLGEIEGPTDLHRIHLLFPNQSDHSKPMSNNTILQALKRMGYQGKMTGHGFRGVASTILHEQGFEHAHIELQLAHQDRDEISAAYNHATYLAPRKVMMQQWANYLSGITTGATIIPIHSNSKAA